MATKKYKIKLRDEVSIELDDERFANLSKEEIAAIVKSNLMYKIDNLSLEQWVEDAVVEDSIEEV